jgi:FG-GAP-like repeat
MPGSAAGLVLTGVFHSGKAPDIVAASGSPFYSPLYQMYLLAGNGDGTFQPPVAISSIFLLSCAAGDYNHDGQLDLACARQSESGEQPGYVVYLGKGDGSFQNPEFNGAVDGILIGSIQSFYLL